MTVGSIVADTYKVVRLIGKGGMGAVWEADHQRLPGKKVAIKVLNADISQDDEQLARFRREAEIASRLGHPNIVAVNDFNTLSDGSPYLVLELLTGEGLDQRIARGVLPWDETVHVTRQIGSALAAAHDQGVVHRDLKPQNVFLCPTDVGGDLITVAKVLDFGISKIRGSQTIKTQEQTLLGTPQYMSPEQATGAHSQIDQRTDLFALAAMVYEMVAGAPAFFGTNVPEVLFKVVYQPAPPLAARAPGVPAPAIAAIEKALSKKPEERFNDVPGFIEALTGRPLGTFRGSSKIPAAVATLGGTPPVAPDEKVATADTQYATGSGPVPDAPGQATAPTIASGSHDKDALPAPASVASKRMAVDPNLEIGLEATVASTGRGTPTPIPGPVGAPPPAETLAAARSDEAPPRTLRWMLAAVAIVGIGVIAVAASLSSKGEKVTRPAATRQRGPQSPPAAPPAARAAAAPSDAPSTAEPTASGAPDRESPPPSTRPQPDEQVVPLVAAPDLGEPDTAASAPAARQNEGDQPAGGAASAQAKGDDGRPTPQRKEPRVERDEAGDDATARAPRRPGKQRAADAADDDGPPDAPPEVAKALADALASYRSGDFSGARLAAQRTIYKRPTPMAYAIVTMSYCGMRDLGNARANFRKVGRWKRRVQRQCRKHGVDL